MQDQIVKGDPLQRITGPMLITGSVVLLIFNALLPRPDDPSDKAQTVQNIADHLGFWEVEHLVLTAGIWALLFGFVGVQRSISYGSAGAFALLGLYGAVVGTTLWTVLFAINGFGLPGIIDIWGEAAGTDKATLFHIAKSVSRLVEAFFSLTTTVYWLALIFLGIGIAKSEVYPRWLGWGLVALGVPTVVVGVLTALAGFDSAFQVAFAALSLLTTLSILGLGVITTRRAW